MYALNYTAKTYDGYDEHWSDDGHLAVSYYGEHLHEMYYDGAWHCADICDKGIEDYLISNAVFVSALSSCRSSSYPPNKVYEFLPADKSGLYPAELLRLLLDDCALELDDACKVIIRAFGESSKTEYHEYLYSVQPRTAHLESVLNDSLKRFAVHEPYNEKFRSPLGAVEDGTELSLSVLTFGDVKSASLLVHGDAYAKEIKMIRAGDRFSCVFVPESPQALWYSFKLNSAECIMPDGDFRLTVYKRGFETPEWFSRSVMYQIFPDRFGFSEDGTAEQGIAYHRSLGQTPELHKSIYEPPRWKPRDFEADYRPDDFYGGTLRGITEKLDYLKGLGIGVIYLNPIVEAASNHRYDTADYSKVDPVLGSNLDYVNLCAEAKKLGIAVVNDGVFSHTGAESIYFNRSGCYDSIGAYESRDSEYFTWYDFRAFPDDYRSWWGFRSLPEVNELCATWQSFIVSGEDSIVRKWLRRGASGWRLDVADELPDEVLSLIRDAAKAEKPDSIIIGEVWEDAVTKVSYGKRRSYALGYSLDSVMNYPLREAVIGFALGKLDSFELRDFLLSQMYNYPQPLYRSLMNLLGSHDVERLHTVLALGTGISALDREAQSRLAISREQNERATALQKLCAVLQYSIPGVPCLYYGDEECLDGARDPFNRAPFEPSGKGLHNFYARLGEIRNSEACLTCGAMEIKTPAPDVIMIVRKYKTEKIVCILNRSSDTLPITYAGVSPLLDKQNDKYLPPLSSEIYKFT